MKLSKLKIGQKSNKKAYSLIELSVVIVVFAIIIAEAFYIATNRSNFHKSQQTQDKMEEIYNAMKVYLVENSRLPCPASIISSKAGNASYGKVAGTEGLCSDDAGVYFTAGNSNLVYGMVPVQDLKLSTDYAQDEFGSKFSYIIDNRFTDAATYSDDNSLMTVNEYNSMANVRQNSNQVMFIILSHGANKYGGFNSNAAVQNSSSSDIYEQSNDLGSIATPTFDDQFVSNSKYDDEFDDIMFYVDRNVIMDDSGSYHLKPCDALTGNDSGETYDGVDMTWPEGQYAQVVKADSECPVGYRETVQYPTKKCGAYGLWQSGVVDPCTQSHNAQEVTGDLDCTGGSFTQSSGNDIRTFSSTATDGLDCTGSGTLNYLIVGGGGGGGGVKKNDDKYEGGGGGGGGGGVATGTYEITGGQTFSVTVGSGGNGGVSDESSGTAGSDGSDSSLVGVDSATGGKGGGLGGRKIYTNLGGDSGSGDSSAKTGGDPQGDDHGGAGGGASMASVGGDGIQTEDHGDHEAGDGAAGTLNNITGSGVTYGGGGGGAGGGGKSGGKKGNGGAGGGGDGSGGPGSSKDEQETASVAGTDGLGGGGGGGGIGASGVADGGADGGKGVVIVSYPTPSP